MTSRLASAILSRTGSIRHSNMSGLRDTIRPIVGSDGSYGSNEYIHKNFYDDENYQSILKCLDGGREIATDLIEYMQDYYDFLQDTIHRLTSYSKKWRSKLKHQPSLSSYNTTKRAQVDTVRSTENLAQLIQTRCDAIQRVINTYKNQVDRMYPSERLTTVRKHYRTDTMKKLFKNAYSSLSKISDEVEELRTKEKKAQETLRQAKIQCQNLSLNETTSKSKLSRANDQQEKEESKLLAVQARLTHAEGEYNREREIYRGKATEIYQQCRVLEEERLNQIRETLIQFAQAVHSSDCSFKLDTIYEDLLSHLNSEQNTLADLDFWAQTYHVNILAKSISVETTSNDIENENSESRTTTTTTTPKPKESQKIQTTNLTAITENPNQSIAETEEEPSVADKPTTSTKAKPKKKKGEPTTPDVAGLNQV